MLLPFADLRGRNAAELRPRLELLAQELARAVAHYQPAIRAQHAVVFEGAHLGPSLLCSKLCLQSRHLHF